MINEIENLVICDVVRTPFCHAKQFKHLTPDAMLNTVIRGLLERNGLSSEVVDGVIAGTVMHDSRWTNIARMASFAAGLGNKGSDYSIQSNCNSGFVALIAAIGEILSGSGSLYIASGVEQMSTYGIKIYEKEMGKIGGYSELLEAIKAHKGDVWDDLEIRDGVLETLTDLKNNIFMLEIGEIMANLFGISREEQDGYALKNLWRAFKAIENGKLSRYIMPIDNIDKDTYPLNRQRMLKRPEMFQRAMEYFGEANPELPPQKFYEKHKKHLERLGIEKIIPTVTMYNSTIPGDGAGGCIVTTEERAKELGMSPRVRIIGWAEAGVDPVLMGLGPVESTEKLFAKPKTERAESVAFNHLDIIEIHEAFAAQVLSVFKVGEERYGQIWDRARVNLHGGSLAFTHPLGATNYRLIANILSRFDEDRATRYALATGCAGGGQGVSMLFERYR